MHFRNQYLAGSSSFQNQNSPPFTGERDEDSYVEIQEYREIYRTQFDPPSIAEFVCTRFPLSSYVVSNHQLQGFLLAFTFLLTRITSYIVFSPYIYFCVPPRRMHCVRHRQPSNEVRLFPTCYQPPLLTFCARPQLTPAQEGYQIIKGPIATRKLQSISRLISIFDDYKTICSSPISFSNLRLGRISTTSKVDGEGINADYMSHDLSGNKLTDND